MFQQLAGRKPNVELKEAEDDLPPIGIAGSANVSPSPSWGGGGGGGGGGAMSSSGGRPPASASSSPARRTSPKRHIGSPFRAKNTGMSATMMMPDIPVQVESPVAPPAPAITPAMLRAQREERARNMGKGAGGASRAMSPADTPVYGIAPINMIKPIKLYDPATIAGRTNPLLSAPLLSSTLRRPLYPSIFSLRSIFSIHQSSPSINLLYPSIFSIHQSSPSINLLHPSIFSIHQSSPSV